MNYGNILTVLYTCMYMYNILYSGNLSREEKFANFTFLYLSAKVFSVIV